MKVVIASEEARIRAWVASALGPDWEAVEAVDGLAARRAVAAEDPDLVITDETMQSYGAFGLARDLKVAPEPPGIIVLLERAQDVWLARWSGADRWLVRPVDPFELADVAREVATAARGGATEGENATTGGIG